MVYESTDDVLTRDCMAYIRLVTSRLKKAQRTTSVQHSYSFNLCV